MATTPVKDFRPPASTRRSVADLGDLHGRTALVVGGAGNLGFVLCEALIECGARVAVMDQDARRCCEAVDALAGRPGAVATAHIFNLSETKNLARVCGDIARLHDSLDIVVHSAAWVGTNDTPGWNAPFAGQSLDAWNDGLSINLTSAFALAQATAPLLKASGNGSMIFVGSIYGVRGPDWRLYADLDMSCPAGYAASKGGLAQLMRYLATTLAPDIRVNMISPGGIFRGQAESFVDRYRKRTPLGRMATEEDIKGAVAFLASDLSRYVTGQDLLVDGGWTAW